MIVKAKMKSAIFIMREIQRNVDVIKEMGDAHKTLMDKEHLTKYYPRLTWVITAKVEA